jgi:hypothetical protein
MMVLAGATKMNPELHNNSVTFFTAGDEMLRISPDGFYVRGQKANATEHEANVVFKAFQEWLTWQQLNRS